MAEAWPQPWIALGSVILEAALGYPDRLHRRLPHPVVWLGAAISGCERAWNRQSFKPGLRRALGVLTVLITAGGAAVAGLILQRSLAGHAWGAPLLILIGTLGLAQRSLYDHVAAVARPLAEGDLTAARTAVGRIVGRDVETLDESGVAAAALESLAESFNDGVVAPVFWFALAGLPGLFAYKALNTADSLIGHMEPRWRDFGWAAARSDDVANLIPARLAGGLIALAGRGGWRTMFRDAHRHASPNAGWPEAAMAGALGVRLGGAAVYDGLPHTRPVFGDGPAPTVADLGRGLRVYLWACGLMALALLIAGALWPH